MKTFFSIKRLIYIGSIVIFLIISYNIIGNTVSIWQRQYVIDQAERELMRVKEENSRLKLQLEETSQRGYVEAEARNKLFYVKPGEQIIAVPKPEEKPKDVEIVRITPWREWLALFF